MKESNLLASVALFSELYNNDKYRDIGDILGEFIKAAIAQENKWEVTSTELTSMLKSIYDFNIPESVIRTTVKNRLKSICERKQGNYYFDSCIKKDFEVIESQYDSILTIQHSIFKNLKSFIEKKEQKTLSDLESNNLRDTFTKYLLGNHDTDKYSQLISAFVIKNQETPHFRENLNLIKEGIVLYQGIQFTADLNELGKWNSELNIYLSTEYLFHAVGYNGLLFEQIFEDFNKLIKQINSNGKTKHGEQLIRLFYLPETKEEFDGFFRVAEDILRGARKLADDKPAMKAILAGCKTPAQIAEKKVKVLGTLKTLGIHSKEFNDSIYPYHDYVVEGKGVMNEVQKDAKRKGREFNQYETEQLLKIFTKINYLRGGDSKTSFEKVRHIFITSKSLALYLAHSPLVKTGEDDIAFAKDLDYITNKFWFKLKKGFSDKNTLPKSFDVVTKAQIILSGQLNQTISNQYDRLQKELQSGILDHQQALQLQYELREKPHKPEEITVDNIDDSLDFLINDTHFEDLKREQELTKIRYEESLKKIEVLERDARLRNEADEAERLRLEKEQYLTEQNDYLNQRWKETKYKQKINVAIFLGIWLLTLSTIGIGIALKASKTLSTWMEEQTTFVQFVIWSIIAVLLALELVTRSYIINKERLKSGWTWLLGSLSQQKREDRKHTYIQQYIKDFPENQIFPTYKSERA